MINQSSTTRKYTHVRNLSNIETENCRLFEDLKSYEIPHANISYKYYSNSEKQVKVPLRITQDKERIMINLSNESTVENTTDNSILAVKTKSSTKGAKIRKFKSCLGQSEKLPTNNENLINIIRENCEKNKVMPCDTFIAPLLALSDYYTNSDNKVESLTSNPDQKLNANIKNSNESISK